jgi:hypothetical protein
MSRSASGAYALPVAYNPVVTLTKIQSAWANTTLADIAQELTNSLDRNGRGAMLAPLQLFNGTISAPGLTWGSETTSGWYRAAAGDFRYAMASVDVAQITADGYKAYDAAGGTAYRVGFRELPQNSQSAAYTLVAGDAGKHIYHPSADTTARIWTIPANASVAFPVGTAITLVNDLSAGVITIAITSDTLVFAPDGTTGSRTLAAAGMATILKVAATRWMISGTGLT